MIKKNGYFFLPYTLSLLSLFLLLIAKEKGVPELWINQHLTPTFDVFFKYITYLGDGLAIVVLCLIFLATNYRYSIFIGLSGLLSGVFTQILKRFVFNDLVRPKAFFSDDITLHFVEGVKIHGAHSFPSGHTTTAFALGLSLTLLLSNKKWGLAFFLLAAVIGFSRVYLMQHFFMDIAVGSIIGICFTILSFYITGRIFPKKFIPSSRGGSKNSRL